LKDGGGEYFVPIDSLHQGNREALTRKNHISDRYPGGAFRVPRRIAVFAAHRAALSAKAVWPRRVKKKKKSKSESSMATPQFDRALAPST